MSTDFLSIAHEDATCPLCNKIFEQDQLIRVILETKVHITLDEFTGDMAPGANLDWHGEEWVHEDCYCKVLALLPTTLEELMK